MSAEAIAIVGVGAALLTVLVPLLLTLAAGIRRELDHVRGDVAALRADVAGVRHDLHVVGERVAHVEAAVSSLDARTGRIEAAVLSHGERIARIEGVLTGPLRPPTNGEPAPAAPADREADR